jgi:hypothetical protein
LADPAPAAEKAADKPAKPATRRVRLNPALGGLSAHEDSGWVITNDPEGTEVPEDVATRMLAHLVPLHGSPLPAAVEIK